MQERVQNIYNIPLDIIGTKDRFPKLLSSLSFWSGWSPYRGQDNNGLHKVQEIKDIEDAQNVYNFKPKQQKLNEGER